MSLFKTSIFNKLLARYRTPADQDIEAHRDVIERLACPAIGLFETSEPTRSHVGGRPTLPADIPWPRWNDAPLAFLCQIDLTELPAGHLLGAEHHGLPLSGMLFFFYETQAQTWGFDPQDAGSWRVIYCTGTPGEAAERAAPEDLTEEALFTKVPLTFTIITSYPDAQDERIEALGLNEVQIEQYMEDWCIAPCEDQPAHQLFGYPAPIQGNDMDLECQLASHGLYCGNTSGYRNPRAKTLAAGRREWRLLLQLDSDDAAGMMWGDCGRLYFWIREADLKARHFEKCWMVLQCS